MMKHSWAEPVVAAEGQPRDRCLARAAAMSGLAWGGFQAGRARGAGRPPAYAVIVKRHPGNAEQPQN